MISGHAASGGLPKGVIARLAVLALASGLAGWGLTAGAPVASASTVTGSVALVENPAERYRISVVHFDGVGAERNDVRLKIVRGGSVRISDRRARLRARGGCRSLDAHSAVCSLLRVRDSNRIRFRLGAGADRLVIPRGIPGDNSADGGSGNDRIVTASRFDEGIVGGPGNDTITGSAREDELSGGSGDDRIVGGGGSDSLAGGPGTDRLEGGPGGDSFRLDGGTRSGRDDDTADGGAGSDNANYVARSVDTTVTIMGARTVVTAPKDTDTLNGIEEVLTGGGDDTWTGDDLRNHMFVGEGTNTVDARGGDDTIELGNVDEESSQIACGAGNDLVVPNNRTLVRPDCELVAAGADGDRAALAQPTSITADTMVFSLPCISREAKGSDFTSHADFVLRLPPAGTTWPDAPALDTVLGSGQVPRGDETKRCSTTIQLNDAGKRLVAEGKPRTVVLDSVQLGWGLLLFG